MITVESLSKRFRVRRRNNLSEQEKNDPRMHDGYFHSVVHTELQCEKGKVLGLLGTNGAGKTTTLRVMATALKPDSGSVIIDGINALIDEKEARKRIGFLSGSTGLYRRLTGRENLTYFGQLHGMRRKHIVERIDYLTDMLSMSDYLDRRSDHYSTGMKQKLLIARAVIHEPSVVILDEPTTGLDVLASTVVLNFIRELKHAGVSVVFSTHHLDEVRELCDTVTVMHEGKTCFAGDFGQFESLDEGSMHGAFLKAIGA